MSKTKKEEVRFSSYTSPVIQIVKYIDKESSSGAPMFDLYLNNERERRYTDCESLLRRLELIIRLSGVNNSGVFAEGSITYGPIAEGTAIYDNRTGSS